jgi:hypothetical protein
MTQDELITAIRAHAIANYNRQGWDFLVECYEDKDILEEIGTAKTLKGAIRKLLPTLRDQDDYRKECSSIW